MGLTGLSAPPATITSASPSRDQPRGVPDRVRSRRAGGDDRMIGPPKAVADRDLPRGEVDQRRGDEEGRDPPRSPFVKQHRRVCDRGQPTDARAHHHPGAQRLRLARVGPARLLHRLLRRRHRVKNELVDLALLLGLHVARGIERPLARPGHLAGIGGGVARGVELGDRPRTRAPGEDRSPGRLDPIRQRRDHAHARDHATPHRILPPVSAPGEAHGPPLIPVKAPPYKRAAAQGKGAAPEAAAPRLTPPPPVRIAAPGSGAVAQLVRAHDS